MSKRNFNGLEKQAQIIGQFKRDARRKSKTDAVHQAMKLTESQILSRERRAKIEALLPEQNFAPGTPAHLEYIKEKRRLEALIK